jgi:outer membrane protein
LQCSELYTFAVIFTAGEMMMKFSQSMLACAVATTLACVAGTSANAFDTNNVTVRGRAIYIKPADKSTGIPSLAAPSDAIEVEKKWAPDIDLEYTFSDHVGMELLLTIPQRHDVTLKQSALGTNVDLGTVDHLPPTLTVKYYPLTGAVRPYLGGGLNFTLFTDDDLLDGALDIKKTSFGPALQAGIDFSLNGNWSLSLDAKKVWISTEVSMGSTKLTTVHVDPLILGVGVGYRFGKH